MNHLDDCTCSSRILDNGNKVIDIDPHCILLTKIETVKDEVMQVVSALTTAIHSSHSQRGQADSEQKPPIEIRATIVQKRYDPILQEDVIDGRFEIKWQPMSTWINLGLNTHATVEWYLIASVFAMGARHIGPDTLRFEHIEQHIEHEHAIPQTPDDYECTTKTT